MKTSKIRSTLLCSAILTLAACDPDRETLEVESAVGHDDRDVFPASPTSTEDENEEAENVEFSDPLLPFAEFERDGHRVSFFVIDEATSAIAVQESSYDRSSYPAFVASGRSPLEIFLRLTGPDVEIPEVLIADYEARVGDVASFINQNQAARNAGLPDDLTMAPQKDQWWPGGGCIPTSEYNYATCYDGNTSLSTYLQHKNGLQPFKFDGPVLYSILRDTDNTNQEVFVVWDDDTTGYCNYGEGTIFMDEGSWAVVEAYSGTGNRSWKAYIASGCYACYAFRSIFMYDATQSSTCGDPF